MRAKTFSITLAVVFLVIVTSVAWLYAEWHKFLTTPLNRSQQSIEFMLKPGTSIKPLAEQLHQAGLIKHPFFFVLLARFEGATRKLKAGEYEVTPGITAKELLHKFVTAQVIMRKVTFVEGWTFQDIMQAIDLNPYLKHTLQGLSDKAIMARIGYPGENPEGRFDPNTYLFSRGTEDVVILRKAYQAMQQILMKQWRSRAKGLPYKTPYQALIAASLIEKETSIPKERAMVAGVIVRRLKKGMRLQIDPTVIFGLGKRYTGKLTTQDLRINTPYNTYLHKGLPPTPIAMPSEASIHAALHPTPGKTLYFVAKGDGSHHFSDTLKAHDKAIRKYLLGESVPSETSASAKPKVEIKPQTKSKAEGKTKTKSEAKPKKKSATTATAKAARKGGTCPFILTNPAMCF